MAEQGTKQPCWPLREGVTASAPRSPRGPSPTGQELGCLLLPSSAGRQEARAGGEAALWQTPGPGDAGSSAGRRRRTGTSSPLAALASPVLPERDLQTAGAWHRFPEIKKIVQNYFMPVASFKTKNTGSM